jgi:hypothetical protein
VPFFFKQWGGINKKKAERLLDDRTWNNMSAPTQNIFHGMNKTGYFDRKYTILGKRI